MAMSGETRATLTTLRDSVHPLRGEQDDFVPLLDRIGEARFVLLGEASHGTHEFYRIRSEITKCLIRTKGFTAIAVEADWPDASRVNRYVRGGMDDADATESLGGFRRFPQWMWRNADVLDFVGWLRAHNDGARGAAAPVGFYGLDLYSLHASIEAVLTFLGRIDPTAAQRAMERYSCFDHFGADPQAYGYATSSGFALSCEAEVIEQLVELRRSAAAYAKLDGQGAIDDLFHAEQNARLVQNAERYYRAMFGSRVSSWNVRDRHMAGTLDDLVGHLGRTGPSPKVVVWAHNSHLGDARATDMGSAGELNVGQLVREQYGDDAVLVGFTTHSGTVTATSNWDEPAQRKRVRPALPGSIEALFHDIGIPNFLIHTAANDAVHSLLREPRLERAIGVIYRPETERMSHYFHARLADQFDMVLHCDVTRAVEPMETSGSFERGELPETYPSSL
jgi:erythromycin esterase-like protein